LLGPGPRLIKKRIYRAAVSQRMRNTVKPTRKPETGEIRKVYENDIVLELLTHRSPN